VLDMLDWSADLPEVRHPAGAVLIREGEIHGRLFVLLDGALEISREGTLITVVDAPGAIFGEMSALLGSAATATVRTVRDTRLRHSDDPQGFLDGHPQVARAVATTLARRLDTINGYLVDLRRQYRDHDNLGMVDTVLESLRHHQVAPCEPGSEREREFPY
jgi:CRP/FNR family transcriptional regulator, cyclic AMP receptor protein